MNFLISNLKAKKPPQGKVNGENCNALKKVMSTKKLTSVKNEHKN
jgi:hypothetical protein